MSKCYSSNIPHDLRSEAVALYSFVEKVLKNKEISVSDLKLAELLMRGKEDYLCLIEEVKNNLSIGSSKNG